MKQQHQPSTPAVELMHDEGGSRYVARAGNEVVAQAQYRMEDGQVAFTHTEVDPSREGQGLASRLAAYALDDVRSRGLKAVPRCSFIAGYLARHEKEYGDLVTR